MHTHHSSRILVTRVCILENVGRTLEMVEVEVVRIAVLMMMPGSHEWPEHTPLEPLDVQTNLSSGTLLGAGRLASNVSRRRT